MIEVSRATVDALPGIAEIERASITPPWSQSALADEFLRSFIAVASDGGGVLGFCVLRRVSVDEAELFRIAVCPAARRRGVGDMLMQAALKFACKNALTTVYLEVRESNAAAISLYEKHGFAKTGLRKNYYDDPAEGAVIMTRRTFVTILAIETSCDETAVAVTKNGREVLAEEIFSQADKHALYGGVVPEIASRNHAAVIGRLTESALQKAGVAKNELDAVAVTYAPGLIGALLVGVNFAKGLALALGIPLVPVHHIRGHIAANYIADRDLEPPFLCLIASGGNTLIADVRGYTDISIIGKTRDDAAGECFDKAARVLGLGYPGGAALDKLAQSGDETLFNLPRPVIDGAPYDMSFSGLKTAVVNIVHNAEQRGGEFCKASLAASLTAAVSDILVPRVMAAAAEFCHDKIAIAGGVAANSRIRAEFVRAAEAEGKTLIIPPLELCGDNAAMIGAQGFYEYLAGTRAGMDLNAYATMDADLTYEAAAGNGRIV